MEPHGQVFGDRFHSRILRTPREVRNVLVYVSKNHVKHGIGLFGLDPYASGKWFDGWREVRSAVEHAWHLARAKTWLLTIGWRRWGPVRLAETTRVAA